MFNATWELYQARAFRFRESYSGKVLVCHLCERTRTLVMYVRATAVRRGVCSVCRGTCAEAREDAEMREYEWN